MGSVIALARVVNYTSRIIEICGGIMEHEQVAASLAELGNSHRLAVFRFLVKVGHDGASVGEIQTELGIPGSTLSHHLARMAKVGLIRQEKHSRTVVCIPEYEHLESLISFLKEECCSANATA